MNTQDYARWFRASTPYISTHRGRTFVVLLPGEALAHPNLTNIVHDLALLHVLGARLVIVHGARPQINGALPSSRLQTHEGVSRRITDAESMRAITGLHGHLRTDLEALFSTGVPSSPLHNADIRVVGGNFVTARPIGVLDGTDYQLTGEPRRVQAARIQETLASPAIVLLSPLGYSPSGQAFNLSADELAGHLAIRLQASKLVVFDAAPCLSDGEGERLSHLTPSQLTEALAASRVGADTRRHLNLLGRAVAAGIASGQLISYKEDGALLAELFTAEGVGTQVTQDDRHLVRRAAHKDVADIVDMIRPLEEAGLLVRRSRDLLEREIGEFLVAELDGFVVGCCALRPLGAAAELACVAVHQAYRNTGGKGVGARLLAAAEAAAKAAGCARLFALTTQTQHWFLENGFREASVADLPATKQADYNHKRNPKVLIKTLT